MLESKYFKQGLIQGIKSDKYRKNLNALSLSGKPIKGSWHATVSYKVRGGHTFSSSEAAILLVSTKNRDLRPWARFSGKPPESFQGPVSRSSQ